MYSVLVVDDEPAARSGISRLVSSVGDFMVVGTAANGTEALKLSELLLPDIVITDINMPKMNGLDFILQLREIHPDAAIIIISGYNEFAYVKRAMKMLVNYYILKPVDKEELIEALWQSAASIAEKNAALETERVYEEQCYSLQHYKTAEFFSDVCHKNKTDYEANRLYEAFRNKNFILAAIDCTVGGIEKMQAYLSGYGHKPIVWKFDDATTAVAIIVNPGLKDTKCVMLKDALKHAQISIFYVGEANSIEEINPVITALRNQLQYELFFNVKCNTKSSADTMPSYSTMSNIMQYQKRLLEAIDLSNKQQAVSIVHAICEYLPQCADVNYRTAKFIVVKISIAASAALCARVSSSSIKETPIDAPECRNLSVWENHLCKMLETGLDEIEATAGNLSQQNMMERVLTLADQFYSEPEMSIEYICRFVFVSPNYLRNLFRKKTGKTFVRYMTELRMRHAAQMLITTQLPISEIAFKVSYTDSGYFSACFKSVYGCTPSDYKEQNAQIQS